MPAANIIVEIHTCFQFFGAILPFLEACVVFF